MKVIRLLQCSSFAFLALCSQQAGAVGFDFTPTAAQYLSDPTYFQSKGQVQGLTNYSFTMASGDISNRFGVKRYDFTNDTHTIAQTLTYGVTDHFRIGLTQSYALAHRENNFVSGAVTKSDSDGFSNPNFTAAYRVLDQANSPVSFDVSLAYAPDLIKAVAATAKDSGNTARGGDAVTVNAAVGYAMKSLTVQGVTGVTYYGQRTVENASTGATSESDSFWAPHIGLNTQTRFTERLALNANVNYVMNESTTGKSAAGLPFKSSQADSTSLGLVLNYHLIPNRLVAGVNYAHTFFTDADTTFTTAPASSTKGSNHDQDQVGVRLAYVFF